MRQRIDRSKCGSLETSYRKHGQRQFLLPYLAGHQRSRSTMSSISQPQPTTPPASKGADTMAQFKPYRFFLVEHNFGRMLAKTSAAVAVALSSATNVVLAALGH